MSGNNPHLKPMALAIDDLAHDLADRINQTGLPPFAVTPILKNLYEQSVAQAAEEVRLAKEQYEQSIREVDDNGIR